MTYAERTVAKIMLFVLFMQRVRSRFSHISNTIGATKTIYPRVVDFVKMLSHLYYDELGENQSHPVRKVIYVWDARVKHIACKELKRPSQQIYVQ
jgi:hypothetical protein